MLQFGVWMRSHGKGESSVKTEDGENRYEEDQERGAMETNGGRAYSRVANSVEYCWAVQQEKDRDRPSF